ncbi:DNA gyrase inhibitor YacG [Marinimicrococcus flavescens]|uniref:DNA gyrase inhibitor YacG n=1 Tax=Marinimicrococcus flavescens TaxID=3031815 RepID=A0AAP3XRF7_9PROT|nr:DNA gyrase inhibitor YacG [Marinimicrococcus flavescens]
MAEKQPGAAQRTPRCPICGKPRAQRYRPFCSARCRDRDLMNWLNGRYAVPAVETEDDEDDIPPSTRPS